MKRRWLWGGEILFMVILGLLMAEFHERNYQRIEQYGSKQVDYALAQLAAEKKWIMSANRHREKEICPIHSIGEIGDFRRESGYFDISILVAGGNDPLKSPKTALEKREWSAIVGGREESGGGLEGDRGAPLYRMISPQRAEGECLGCHQEVKGGELMAGISLSVSLESFLDDWKTEGDFLLFLWAFIGVILFALNFLIFRILPSLPPRKESIARKKAEKEFREGMGSSLGWRVLLPTLLTLIVGFGVLLYLTIQKNADDLYAENMVNADLMSSTIIKSLQSMMINGRAMDVAQWAQDLKKIDKKEVAVVQFLRLNGEESFKDNRTIQEVNDRLGTALFEKRKEDDLPMEWSDIDQPKFQETIRHGKKVYYYEQAGGQELLTLLTPIINREECHHCHGAAYKVRGILKISTPLDDILDRVENSKRYMVLLSGLMLLSVAALILALLRKTVTSPIYYIGKTIRTIARGNLKQQIPRFSNDEIGELTGHVNKMVSDMRDTLSTVARATKNVNEFAHEISGAVDHHSAISTEQSASVTEITSTMEELSQTSIQIAEHSNSVVSIANRALDWAQDGVSAVEEVMVKMDDIRDGNNESAEEIIFLGKMSKEIGGIMEIINNIADRTKLIAFNSALEASGAGEAGKRFEVVAQEIRRLAESVMESTEEISALINQIQGAVDRLMVSTKNESTKIEKGLESSLETVGILRTMLGAAKSTTEEAKQISLSTKQQKVANNQVVLSIKEIATGATEASSTISQTSEIAKKMADLSTQLNNMVRKFEV